MKRIVLTTAVAMLVAVPAFAQNFAPAPGTGDIQANRPVRMHARHAGPLSAYGAVTPFGSPAAEPVRGGREAAIKQCSAVAAKTYAVRDSNWSLSAYRACMAERGQPE